MSETAPFLLGGTDGVRGVATFGPHPVDGELNPTMVAGLTYALTREQLEVGNGGVIVIGHDTRPSSPTFEVAAVAGAIAAGATDIIRLGCAPTPMTLKLADMYGASAAVSITASHNEHPDNGWKGTYGSDKPIGDQVTTLSDRYWEQHRSGLHIPLNTGDYTEAPEFRDAYVAELVGDIRKQFNEKPLAGKIFVIDAANGAAMSASPEVFRQLGAEVVEFACDGNGEINEGCGATDLEGAKAFLRDRPELVANKNFMGVIAHDGDADRVIALGASMEGNEIVFSTLEGNRFMELYATGEPGIIGTDYTNDGMINRLRSRGTGFEFCENGDVNVTAALRAKQAEGLGWQRGGEFTGHHVDLSWLSSGDGIRMAAWVAAYAVQHDTDFNQLAAAMPLWPEVMMKIKLQDSTGAIALAHEAVVESATIARQRVEATGGRILLRPSGTERKVGRAWGVGPDRIVIEQSLRQIVRTTGEHFALAV